MSSIQCTVENCVFNDDHLCKAEAIEVNALNDSTSASNSDYTLCHTFKPERE
jgi:hypothetical protein